MTIIFEFDEFLNSFFGSLNDIQKQLVFYPIRIFPQFHHILNRTFRAHFEELLCDIFDGCFLNVIHIQRFLEMTKGRKKFLLILFFFSPFSRPTEKRATLRGHHNISRTSHCRGALRTHEGDPGSRTPGLNTFCRKAASL